MATDRTAIPVERRHFWDEEPDLDEDLAWLVEAEAESGLCEWCGHANHTAVDCPHVPLREAA